MNSFGTTMLKFYVYYPRQYVAHFITIILLKYFINEKSFSNFNDRRLNLDPFLIKIFKISYVYSY